LDFYWIKDVEKLLGLSLPEYRHIEKERLLKIEKEGAEARIISENIRKEKLIKDVHELSSSDPKYTCIDNKTIESSIIKINTNAVDILNHCLKQHDVKEFDKILKKHTRSQKVSICDVRDTHIYRQRVLDNIFCNLTEDEWINIKSQVDENKIQLILDRMELKNKVYMCPYCPLSTQQFSIIGVVDHMCAIHNKVIQFI